MMRGYLNTKEAAKVIGVTPGHVVNLIKKGCFGDVQLASGGFTGRPTYWIDSDEVYEFSRTRREQILARAQKQQEVKQLPEPEPNPEEIRREVRARMDEIVNHLVAIESLLQKLEGS